MCKAVRFNQRCDVCLQQSNIAWSYDREHLYGDYTPYNFNVYPDKRGGNTSTEDVNDNQHLMVWLRPAAQPSFRKLWAVITVPLAAGAAPSPLCFMTPDGGCWFVQ